jgi:hypothetical protein
MFHVTPALPSGLAMKPESMPPAIFLQGSAKVDCVAVWFFCHVTDGGLDRLGGVEEGGCHSSLDGLHSTDNDLGLLA